MGPEWAPEVMQKHRKSLPNGRQQNPRGRREAPPCCLRFGKDFRCFCITSGAHSGPILVFPHFFWVRFFHLPCSSHQSSKTMLHNTNRDVPETEQNGFSSETMAPERFETERIMLRNGPKGVERNGFLFGTERNGTDFCSGRSGTEPNPQM